MARVGGILPRVERSTTVRDVPRGMYKEACNVFESRSYLGRYFEPFYDRNGL